MAPPGRSYLICATPRSGTTLLCEALRNTGVAGRPEEYFQQLSATGLPRTPRDYFADAEDPELRIVVDACTPPDVQVTDESTRFATWQGYFDWALARGTTPNGVFGAKLMWAYLDGLLANLSTLPCCARARTDVEVLERALPRLDYVFVTRADKAGQAVSLWRALQTWRWQATADGSVAEEPVRAVYSFEAIEHLVKLLAEEEGAWLSFFDRHGIEPLRVVYEELADSHDDTAAKVLRHLGVPVPARARAPEPRMRRQADELSQVWIGRYMAEAGARVGL